MHKLDIGHPPSFNGVGNLNGFFNHLEDWLELKRINLDQRQAATVLISAMYGEALSLVDGLTHAGSRDYAHVKRVLHKAYGLRPHQFYNELRTLRSIENMSLWSYTDAFGKLTSQTALEGSTQTHIIVF